MARNTRATNNSNKQGLYIAGGLVIFIAMAMIALAVALNSSNAASAGTIPLTDVLAFGNTTGNHDIDFTDGDAINNPGFIGFDVDEGPPTVYAKGNMYWDTNDETIAIQQGLDDVILQLGQEMYIRVHNDTGGTILNGQVVYLNGVSGQRPTVALAQADSIATSTLIGMATHDIEDTTEGLITVTGLVRDLDTSMFSEGDTVYLNEVVAGDFSTIPASPNVAVQLGIVTYSHASEGIIHVQTDPFRTGIVSYDDLRVHGFIEYDITESFPPYAEGRVFYDNIDKTLAIYNSESEIVQQIGQEGFIRVYNDTGLTITDGAVVYISGVEGVEFRPTIGLADATARATSEVLGLVTHPIEDASFGFVTTVGLINLIDTSSVAASSVLYLSDTVPGAFTEDLPSVDHFIVQLGYTIRSHATEGRILIVLNPNLASAVEPIIKGYSITTQGGFGTGDFWVAGNYDFPATDANLTQASLTQVHGTANNPASAHASAIVAAAGSVDTGTVSLVVSGTSITDSGVRTTSDTETIIADITAVATDEYYETAKKWLGVVTYTLTPTGGAPTTYSLDFNYGYAKYDDAGNSDFEIASFEMVGEGGNNDTGFEVVLYHHSAVGWTYAATGFAPGNTQIASSVTDLGGDDNLFTGVPFAYKRLALGQQVTGSTSEGFVIRVTTSANNAIEFADIHVGIILN